jgi:hypothetical protein
VIKSLYALTERGPRYEKKRGMAILNCLAAFSMARNKLGR